jgi:hypothetical protein
MGQAIRGGKKTKIEGLLSLAVSGHDVRALLEHGKPLSLFHLSQFVISKGLMCYK